MCNPLCCIMFLFTFQVFGVVRGTLIHWLVAFHTHCVSVSLSLFVHPSPLYVIQTSNTHIPPAPLSLLTQIPFCLKEEVLDYLTPPVWARHHPIFLPVDHQPVGLVTEGEILRLNLHTAVSLPSLGILHGVVYMHLRRRECHSQLFSCFLSSVTDEAPPKPAPPPKC